MKEFYMEILAGLICGIAIGLMIGLVFIAGPEIRRLKTEAIDFGVGHYVVDPKTGETEFKFKK